MQKEQKNVIGTYRIHFPDHYKPRDQCVNLTWNEIQDRIIFEDGPKYVQKLCDGILKHNFGLGVNNPKLPSAATIKMGSKTRNVIKALEVIPGTKYPEGRKYPDKTLKNEVELRYLDLVYNNLKKGIWVNLLPLYLDYPSVDASLEVKDFFLDAGSMYNNIKKLNELMNSKHYPGGPWMVPKAYGGSVEMTDRYNDQVITYKTRFQLADKEFPIKCHRSWIPSTTNDFEDIKLVPGLKNWNPPLILDGFGSFCETNFGKGYEDHPFEILENAEDQNVLENATLPPKLVKNNEALIRVRKIPTMGPTKCLETLTDKDGNNIPLKIELGIYWIPEKITSQVSPQFTNLKFDLKNASSKAKKHAIGKLWKEGEEADLKKLEEDIKEARLALKKVKMSGTKVPILKKMQVKAGLYFENSNFTHIVAKDTVGDVWSDHTSKIGDLIKEQELSIKILEFQKQKILKELECVEFS